MKRFAGAALAGLMGVLTATGAAADAYEAMFWAHGIEISDTLREADRAVAAGDYKRAKDLLTPLAWGGDADAQVMLGIMYANEHVPEVKDSNYFVAQTLICTAHAEGHPIARDIATEAGDLCD
jgi:hypothetical protein